MGLMHLALAQAPVVLGDIEKNVEIMEMLIIDAQSKCKDKLDLIAFDWAWHAFKLNLNAFDFDLIEFQFDLHIFKWQSNAFKLDLNALELDLIAFQINSNTFKAKLIVFTQI